MRYLIHGLVVESPVAIAADPSEAAAADLVVTIRPGLLPEGPGDGHLIADATERGERGYRVYRDGGRWTMHFDGVASATWTPTYPTIEVIVRPGVADGLLSVLVGGPLLVTVVMSRGLTILHTSAALLGELGVVAFAGARGSGKSTVARLLARAGRELFTDDALRVDVGGEVLAYRGTTSSRLREHVARGDLDNFTTSADGRTVVPALVRAPAVAPLAGVLALRLSRQVPRVAVRPVPGSVGVLTIAGSWPVDGVRSGDVLANRLAWAADLVRRVPVAALDVVWGSVELDDISREIVNVITEWLSRGVQGSE